MSMKVKNGKYYDFPVSLRPVFFYNGDDAKEVIINGTQHMTLTRDDTMEPLSICSSEYVIIKHSLVFDYVEEVMKHLGYSDPDAYIYLWKNGAIMHLFTKIDKRTINVAGLNLHANIVATNSYNREELARIEIKFTDSDGVIYGDGLDSSITANKIAKHKVGHRTAESEFGTLTMEIDQFIVSVSNLWNRWAAQRISGERLKVLGRLTTPNIAEKLYLRGYFNSGISRFGLYKICCEEFFRMDTFEKDGKSGFIKMSKIRRWLADDDFFDDKVTIEQLKRYADKSGFTYEELAERKRNKIEIVV